MLGDPGIFIEDRALTQDYFFKYSPFEISQMLLSEEPNTEGFCLSTSDTIEKLFNYMQSTPDQKSQDKVLNLFITHDVILGTVVGHFFPKISLELLWPDYLEGLIFFNLIAV